MIEAIKTTDIINQIIIELPPCLREIIKLLKENKDVDTKLFFLKQTANFLMLKTNSIVLAKEYLIAIDYYIKPSIERSILNQIFMSFDYKNPSYHCNGNQLRPFCNKQACLQLEYGLIKLTNNSRLQLKELIKYVPLAKDNQSISGKITYSLLVNDFKIAINNIDNLLNYKMFSKIITEAIDTPPFPIKNNEWHNELEPLFKEIKIVYIDNNLLI